jgi:hypothetical protein
MCGPNPFRSLFQLAALLTSSRLRGARQGPSDDCRTVSNIVHVSTLCARHHREQPRVTNPCHATVTLTSYPHLRLILRRHFVQYYGRPLSSSLVELCSDCVAQFTASSGTTARFDAMISTKAHLRRRILCHVHYYVGQCYGQSYAQLSPALWLRRVRPLLHRTVPCHGFVRSYGYGPIPWVCPVLWLRCATSSFTMPPLDPMSSRQCGVQYYGSMDLWYVWSDPMPGSMVCAVRSYVWIYGMCGLSCVAKHYGSVWYVWSYPMPASPMMVWYVWRCPTSPRPAILWYARSYPMPPPAGAGFYVFRPITSDVGLGASVWSTQDDTRSPLGGVAPRRAEVPTGGTHTPVFDSTGTLHTDKHTHTFAYYMFFIVPCSLSTVLLY